MKSATDKTQPSKAGCLVPLPTDRLISLAELTNATAAVVEPNDCTYRMVDRQTPRAVGSFSPRGMVKEVHIVALMNAIDGGTVTARSLHTRVPYGESEHIHSDWVRTSVAYGLTYADAERFCERLALEAQPIDAEAMQAEPVVADSASNAAAAWAVIKPKRYNGYTAPLHRLLAAAHRDGKTCPTARDVVEEWRNNTPAEIAKVLSDGFDYYNAEGDTKTADLEAIRKAIGRMTSAR